jgi:site-specific recombinase XerC
MLGGSIVDVPLSTSTVLATRDELFSTDEQLALAGFLAGYSGLTRDAYTLDLRQYVAWCTEHHLAVFGTRRADIECFARHLESLGRARATIARRLCTVACFYRYAEQEGMIAVSPAAHVRRPRLDYESHATGLDRNEVGAMLVAAGLAGAREIRKAGVLAVASGVSGRSASLLGRVLSATLHEDAAVWCCRSDDSGRSAGGGDVGDVGEFTFLPRRAGDLRP